jgi:predicted O-methyltransferase YrrM
MTNQSVASSKASISTLGLVLRKPWYWFWRTLENVGYRGKSYTISVPFGQRIYTPWFADEGESEFQNIIRKVHQSGPTAVSLDRCFLLYQLARAATFYDGPMAECGVYTGGSAQLLAEVIARRNRQNAIRLHLFDSFAGMPESSTPDRDYHSPGDFSDTSLAGVQERLKEHTDGVTFHPGFMPDTFSEVQDVSGYSFVHVDVDIYPSVKVCCEWFWPRLCRGGVMVFDDYGFYPYRHAARAAVDEFFANHSEKPITLPTGQAFVTKLLIPNDEP